MVLIQINRNLTVLGKSAKPRHRRSASTLRDCLDIPPPRDGRSPWLLFIVVLVLLYYVYYCRIGDNYAVLSKLETTDENPRTEDVTVVLKEETSTVLAPRAATPLSTTELPCRDNECDIEALSNPRQKQIKVSDFYRDADAKEPCHINMDGRGRLKWNDTETKVKLTRGHYPTVRLGGYHRPTQCQSRHKVAIIVPYRDNEKTLNVFLFNIHPFLIGQNIEYRIFVIEQTGPDDLNKGSLRNVGYEQALRFGSWHCLVFHEVDLLPLDERILYTCPTYPRHMSTTVLGQEIQSKYNLFGGVVAMSEKHFLQVNGYSNTYWGCLGADSDMYWRIRLMGFRIVRYDKKIAVYTKLPFPPQTDRDTNVNGHELTHAGTHQRQQQFRMDGLSTIHYKVIDIQQRILYTHVLVDLGPTPNYTTSRIF